MLRIQEERSREQSSAARRRPPMICGGFVDGREHAALHAEEPIFRAVARGAVAAVDGEREGAGDIWGGNCDDRLVRQLKVPRRASIGGPAKPPLTSFPRPPLRQSPPPEAAHQTQPPKKRR